MFQVDHCNDSVGGTNTRHDLVVLNVLLDKLTGQLCANQNAGEDDPGAHRLPCKLLLLNTVLDEIYQSKDDEWR